MKYTKLSTKLLFILFMFVVALLATSCDSASNEQAAPTTTRILVKPAYVSELGYGVQTLQAELWNVSIADYNLLNEGDTLKLARFTDKGEQTVPRLCVIQRMYDTTTIASN